MKTPPHALLGIPSDRENALASRAEHPVPKQRKYVKKRAKIDRNRDNLMLFLEHRIALLTE
jgi:hypothetical protein